MKHFSNRIERNNQNILKLLFWFGTHEPFNFGDPLLKILSNGVRASAEDNVNRDDAENMGAKIQASRCNICV